MTKRQIEWAATHDWFIADCGNGSVQVVDRWWNVHTGERGDDYLTFSDFAELRAWAGY